MNGIAFVSLILTFQYTYCSFVSLFDEWAKIKEEPSPGNGLYEVVPLFIGTCEPAYKRDPNVWINSTVNIIKKNGGYNVEVDLYYPENVSLHMIHSEGWGKADKKIFKITEITIKRPCKYPTLRPILRVLNIHPPCTVLKGHYKAKYEDLNKILTTIAKYLLYMRVIWKLEFFSEKGQYGCRLAVSDVQQKQDN